MQLYNYEDIINKQPIYHLCKKKYLKKYLKKYEKFVFKYFYKIRESKQGFGTKDIYIQ